MGTSGFVPFCLAAVLKFVIIEAVSAGKYPEIHQAEFRIGAPANFKYTGHVYRKISASSRLKCAASCLRSGATCASFNYCGSTKLCEFNNATASDYPGHLKSADGCLYFDIIFDTTSTKATSEGETTSDKTTPGGEKTPSANSTPEGITTSTKTTSEGETTSTKTTLEGETTSANSTPEGEFSTPTTSTEETTPSPPALLHNCAIIASDGSWTKYPEQGYMTLPQGRLEFIIQTSQAVTMDARFYRIVLGPSYCNITYWDGTVFHDVADGQGVDCINACHFWVEYSNGMMKVGKHGNEVPLMQGVGPTLDFTYFYVTSNEPIEWKIYDGCT